MEVEEGVVFIVDSNFLVCLGQIKVKSNLPEFLGLVESC